MKTADVYVQNSLSVYIFSGMLEFFYRSMCSIGKIEISLSVNIFSGILEFFYGSTCSIVKIEIKSQLKALFYLF